MPLCDWEHRLSLGQKFKLKQVSQHKKQQTTTEIATATMVMFPGKYLYLKRWIQDGDKNCESRSLIARYSQEGFHPTSESLPQWFCRSDRSTGTPYTSGEGRRDWGNQTDGRETNTQWAAEFTAGKHYTLTQILLRKCNKFMEATNHVQIHLTS